MPKITPEPDEFGRLRVRDEDTGHELSIPADGLPHGNYTALDEPASNSGGDPLPPKHATKPLSRSTSNPNSGQKADTVKEIDHG